MLWLWTCIPGRYYVQEEEEAPTRGAGGKGNGGGGVSAIDFELGAPVTLPVCDGWGVDERVS